MLLWQANLQEYDELEGIKWQWQSLDGVMRHPPLTEEPRQEPIPPIAVNEGQSAISSVKAWITAGDGGGWGQPHRCWGLLASAMARAMGIPSNVARAILRICAVGSIYCHSERVAIAFDYQTPLHPTFGVISLIRSCLFFAQWGGSLMAPSMTCHCLSMPFSSS